MREGTDETVTAFSNFFSCALTRRCALIHHHGNIHGGIAHGACCGQYGRGTSYAGVGVGTYQRSNSERDSSGMSESRAEEASIRERYQGKSEKNLVIAENTICKSPWEKPSYIPCEVDSRHRPRDLTIDVSSGRERRLFRVPCRIYYSTALRMKSFLALIFDVSSSFCSFFINFMTDAYHSLLLSSVYFGSCPCDALIAFSIRLIFLTPSA